MTTELVTAHAGTNHVGSEDIGALYAGALGSGRYALDVGEGMAVSMADANTVRIGTGGFVFDGRWVRVTEAEEVKVQSGYQAAYRKDLVTYTYTRDPSSGNVEAGEWGVVMGTAAAKEEDAKLPTVETASILDRDLKVVCPVAEVDIAGLTPTAKLLLPSVRSLKALGESVSLFANDYWTVCKVGQLMLVRASEIVIEDGSWATLNCPYTVPEAYRPANTWEVPMTVGNGGSTTRMLRVRRTGVIDVFNYGSTGSRNVSNGTLVYPIGL